MCSPTLIVVHGAAASGKTELSRYLAEKLGLPLISKDEIKETLFAHFDHHSVAESDRIDAASLDLLWVWLETFMAGSQRALVVETAFPEAISQPRLMELVQRHRYAVVQIFCHATEPVLRQREIWNWVGTGPAGGGSVSWLVDSGLMPQVWVRVYSRSHSYIYGEAGPLSVQW